MANVCDQCETRLFDCNVRSNLEQFRTSPDYANNRTKHDQKRGIRQISFAKAEISADSSKAEFFPNELRKKYVMTDQPNYLSSRLRRLQAETRKEYEESGREKLDEPKIMAAAVVYAEDQAAHHSSGYQSNDSAPEESNEESTNDRQSDFVCTLVGNNLRTMTLEDLNRPWHEEVDEYLSAEQAPHHASAPILCNGHGDSATSSHWAQQKAQNILLENRQDVTQPNGAGQVSWPKPQSQLLENQTPAEEWSCQTQPTSMSQTYASNAYRLFDEPASVSTTIFHDADHNSTQHVDHQQWQSPVAAQTPQYAFQDRCQFDERPIAPAQWVAQSSSHRDEHQQWAQSAQCIDRQLFEQQQWAQSAQLAGLQPREQHQYTDVCDQADWRQHSDGRRRPSPAYHEPAHEAPVYLQRDNIPHWTNAAITFNDLVTNPDNPAPQFISQRVVSVAAALSTINSASSNDVTNEYLEQTSPVRPSCFGDSTSQYTTSPVEYQNNLLKIIEPSTPLEASQTFRVANCVNADTCYDDQVVCVESQQPKSKRYYVLVDQPPSLLEVDVSKPPPPLPPILNNGGSVNTTPNSSNTTDVNYIHQTHARHLMQPSSSTLVHQQALYHESPPLKQSPSHTPLDIQRYASQQNAQSSHYSSDSLYPQLTLEMIHADTLQSDTQPRIAQSSSYSPIAFHPHSSPEILRADVSLSDAHQHIAQLPSYSQGPLYPSKSPQMLYADAPQSDVNYWETPLPHSPPQGTTPDMLYSEVAAQQKMMSESTNVQPSHCEISVNEFAMQRRASPTFEALSPEYNKQPPFNPHFETGDERQPPFNPTIDDFRRQSPTIESMSHLSSLQSTSQVKYSQSASTAQTRRSFCTTSPTEIRTASTNLSTPRALESAQTTPTNQVMGMRRDGPRWASSRNSNQSAQNTPTNPHNGTRKDTKRSLNSRNTNDSGYSTRQDRCQQQRHSGSGGRFGSGIGDPASGNRSMKRVSYSPEEEHRLSVSLMDSYGVPLDALLNRCFSKFDSFGVRTCNLRSNRHGYHGEDMFVGPLWPKEACVELAQLKNRLNSVKERLSSYDLNEWHRHTRTTNPADMVMRRLRSDTKVEFLTQAWCKFYELVDHFKLIPRDARKGNELRTIHLCEAPGAFVASLNHYLRLNHPQMKWRWRANSLNPYYEGNHLSSMINDDRFMLQTIENWDFGPDMTGDIMHPGYPDHLRQVWGDGQLTHLVTADGSFDCQDKPEEQEKLVSWLHLKEALTAIRVLRKGGHFVIKMFTFFECESICLLYLLQCVFESIDVMKPATSKEGNSEVYVVCREFKDEPSFEPFIRRLLDIDLETYSRFAMFPLERIPRPFMRSVENCATKFANCQIDVIERNIRLYQHERYAEFRRHFEFVQEKLFEEYVQRYRVRPIPLDQTVVRMPHRRSENRFHNSSKVLEQRERKQGSHDDQLKRSSLGKKDLIKVVADEVAAFPPHQLHSRVSTAPKVELLPQDFVIRHGKPIHTITSSQFCHGMLIRVRNELMNTLDHKQYYIAAAEMQKSVDMENNTERYPNLCDFAKPLMMMKTYNDTQREIYNMLFDRLASLGKNEHLTLFCFPLLTQFNISVLCILNQIFEEIVFEPPNILYLRKRDTRNFELWMPKLQEISRTYTPEQTVISFLPIRKITGSNNPFYSWVIEANNSMIIREIKLFSSYHS